jgi:hypothetical protein
MPGSQRSAAEGGRDTGLRLSADVFDRAPAGTAPMTLPHAPVPSQLSAALVSPSPASFIGAPSVSLAAQANDMLDAIPS